MLQAIDAYQLFLIVSFAVMKRGDAKLRQSTASQQSYPHVVPCGRGAADASASFSMSLYQRPMRDHDKLYDIA
jgi:hypothetical protein